VIRLILLVLIVFAAWQAKLHYPKLLHRERVQELIVENRGDVPLERLRIRIGDRTLVREVIAPGAKTTFTFNVLRDSRFDVQWIWADRIADYTCTVGHATVGQVARHTIRIAREKEVFHDAIDLPS